MNIVNAGRLNKLLHPESKGGKLLLIAVAWYVAKTYGRTQGFQKRSNIYWSPIFIRTTRGLRRT
jgi:hypothetical protein